MNRRDRETVSRQPVLERDQLEGAARRSVNTGRRRGGLRRLVPVLIVLIVVLLVAREEVPAVATWWEKSFAPQSWAVKQVCQQAALKLADNPDFVRVIDPGAVHETGNGFYLNGLVLGDMGATGVEQRVTYSCYTDSSYHLVKINRLE